MNNSAKVWLERLEHGDDASRDEAIRVLGGLTPADEDDVPDLIDGLKREVSEIRFWAATALACIGSGAEGAVPALIELLQDQVPGNRRAAAFALGRIGDVADPAVPALLWSIEHDPNEFVRQEAVRALGAVGTPAAVAALIGRLEDRDHGIRRYAVIALKMLGPGAREALPALRQLMTREKERGIRDQVEAALKLIGE